MVTLLIVFGAVAWACLGILLWALLSDDYDPPWPIWMFMWPIGVVIWITYRGDGE